MTEQLSSCFVGVNSAVAVGIGLGLQIRHPAVCAADWLAHGQSGAEIGLGVGLYEVGRADAALGGERPAGIAADDGPRLAGAVHVSGREGARQGAAAAADLFLLDESVAKIGADQLVLGESDPGRLL